MALIQMEFKSKTLKRTVPVNVILPIEKFKGPYPTLYLLHGLTDNCNGWLSYSRIRLWAEDSGLAVVMPSGENSFYIQNAMEDEMRKYTLADLRTGMQELLAKEE